MTRLPDPQEFRAPPGRICLVGAGPGAADLLTLRALDRIRAADIVFYDRLIDAEVLALIPPGVERVNVGKEVGRCKWPQPKIDAAIVEAALRGLSVVRLKSGDPSIFGRAAEEIEAARAHGIAVEIIPGVTAASAASAAALSPLTERGRFDRLVMLTATALTGALPDDFTRCLAPGTRVAIYMGVHLANRIEYQLLKAGLRGDSGVLIGQNVSTARERYVRCRLDTLSATIVAEQIANPAVIFLDIESTAGIVGAAHRAAQAACPRA